MLFARPKEESRRSQRPCAQKTTLALMAAQSVHRHHNFGCKGSLLVALPCRCGRISRRQEHAANREQHSRRSDTIVVHYAWKATSQRIIDYNSIEIQQSMRTGEGVLRLNMAKRQHTSQVRLHDVATPAKSGRTAFHAVRTEGNGLLAHPHCHLHSLWAHWRRMPQ